MRFKKTAKAVIFMLECVLLLVSIIITDSIIFHLAGTNETAYILPAFLVGSCAFAYSLRNVAGSVKNYTSD